MKFKNISTRININQRTSYYVSFGVSGSASTGSCGSLGIDGKLSLVSFSIFSKQVLTRSSVSFNFATISSCDIFVLLDNVAANFSLFSFNTSSFSLN